MDELAFASGVQQPDEPVVFVNQVHVVAIRGGAAGPARKITDRFDGENTSAVFSPDGRSIVYQSGGDLRAVGTDGTHDRRLTSAGGMGDECPSFSPDGARIAFTRGTSGDCCGTGAAALVVMDADGGEKRAVPAAGRRG